MGKRDGGASGFRLRGERTEAEAAQGRRGGGCQAGRLDDSLLEVSSYWYPYSSGVCALRLEVRLRPCTKMI